MMNPSGDNRRKRFQPSPIPPGWPECERDGCHEAAASPLVDRRAVCDEHVRYPEREVGDEAGFRRVLARQVIRRVLDRDEGMARALVVHMLKTGAEPEEILVELGARSRGGVHA